MPQSTTLTVRVKPGAKATSVALGHGVVNIRVKEPPHEGKANEACRRTLAQALEVPPSTVKLLRGARSRVKVFALTSLTQVDLAARLSRMRP